MRFEGTVPVYALEPFAAAAEAASKALQRGRVIATPTDTIYGLAALVQNDDAVARLYAIKGRDPKKPIAAAVSDVAEIRRWAELTVSDALLARLLPGPVTLILRRKPELNRNFNPDTDLIGLRVPDHDFTRAISRLVEGPVALTSANLSAGPSTLAIEEFRDLFPSLDAVFDGGRLSDTEEARLGSTVVDLSRAPDFYSTVRRGCAYSYVRGVLAEFGIPERSD